MSPSSYAPLDEALESLSSSGPDLVNGNFNHAPMVAEALCALGRPDVVRPWVERYRARLKPRPSRTEPIAGGEWRGALGHRDRFADWSEFFELQLRGAAWRDVVILWAGRLAPGLSGAATHGVIRVGHAVRALDGEETEPRRRELADALASWAATYQELPAASVDGALPAHDAIKRIAVVPPGKRRPGNIAASLARLGEFPGFAAAFGLADLEGDTASRLAELTELFARVFVTNVCNIGTAIAFIHGVTSLAAAGRIAAMADATTASALLRYGWQAGCGLYACYGGPVPFAEETPTGAEDWPELADRAVANSDEHVIKFTEACLSRNRAAPSPAYRTAVARLLRTMSPTRSQAPSGTAG